MPGHLYLHTGWEKFARAHNLEVGCFLNFLYKGEGELSVKVFETHHAAVTITTAA
jgi:hypothetical protein